MQRFMMRLDPAWRPLLWPFGAAEPSSFVEVDEKRVRFKFGYLFDRSVLREEIERAYRRDWPIWMGVGWRSNLRGVIGLIGSTRGVAEIQLRSRSRAWRVFPCDRIAVSLLDPDGFVAALQPRDVATLPPVAPQPASTPPEAEGAAPPKRKAPGRPAGRSSSRQAQRPPRKRHPAP